MRTAGPRAGGAEAAAPRGTPVPAARGMLGAFRLPARRGVARPPQAAKLRRAAAVHRALRDRAARGNSPGR